MLEIYLHFWKPKNYISNILLTEIVDETALVLEKIQLPRGRISLSYYDLLELILGIVIILLLQVSLVVLVRMVVVCISWIISWKFKRVLFTLQPTL